MRVVLRKIEVLLKVGRYVVILHVGEEELLEYLQKRNL